jgi:hypothetical protein
MLLLLLCLLLHAAAAATRLGDPELLSKIMAADPYFITQVSAPLKSL